MPLIELQTLIHAPIERVFDLARSIDAHMASTEGTSERAIAGRTTGLIELGEMVTWEARHFGVKQHLMVKITQMVRPRMFADEMVKGAFATMRHVHTFETIEEGVLMRDEFLFAAPLGILGRLAEFFFLTSYMRRFLLLRNEILKRTAESDDEWRKYLQQ